MPVSDDLERELEHAFLAAAQRRWADAIAHLRMIQQNWGNAVPAEARRILACCLARQAREWIDSAGAIQRPGGWVLLCSQCCRQVRAVEAGMGTPQQAERIRQQLRRAVRRCRPDHCARCRQPMKASGALIRMAHDNLREAAVLASSGMFAREADSVARLAGVTGGGSRRSGRWRRTLRRLATIGGVLALLTGGTLLAVYRPDLRDALAFVIALVAFAIGQREFTSCLASRRSTGITRSTPRCR